MRARAFVLAWVVLVLTLATAPLVGVAAPSAPQLPLPGPLVDREPPPPVTADAWIVFDASAGVVLGSRNADTPLPMASTTKMMTALLAVELGDLSSIVTVSDNAADAGEAEIGLVAGEQFPLGDLVTVMLVRSANDAAIAVAEHIAGDVETFVGLMNQRAGELGLTRTSFRNPHGLDEDGHVSTARDLLRLGLAAMSVAEIRDATARRSFEFPEAPDGTARPGEATNELLDVYEGTFGVKTGFTFQAGLVLVAAVERDDRVLYSVVMGSEGAGAHFSDSTALLDFGFRRTGLLDAVAGETVFDGTLVDRVARLETQLHVASLLAAASRPGDVAQLPEVLEAEEATLPSLTDAFGWFLGLGRG